MTKATAKKIYLDHAAATPLDSEVLAHMQPFLTDQFYNPSATYLAAKKVRQAVEDARARTAKVLGVRPGEIVFTAGATEANNLAIHGVMAKHPGKKILVSAIEHDSVLAPAKQYSHEIIPIQPDGLVDLDKLKALLTDDVVLVSIMYANNEVGAINHPSLVQKIIKEVRGKRIMAGSFTPLYFHVDAAQAPNTLALFPKTHNIDLLSLNGGKIYGPKQSGALYINAGTELDPLILGGGQERGLRSGTENVAGIVGFSYAFEKAVTLREAEEKRLASLHKLFHSELAAKVPQAEVTTMAVSLYNLIHIVIPGADNERLMMELDEAGIQCAVGSACSASNDEPSHVLKALGFSDRQAQASLRFTMGRSTTEADVLRTVGALAKLV
jgi:cysteine desulfurase